MKKILIMLFLLPFSLLLAQEMGKSVYVHPGDYPPEINLFDSDGKLVKLSEFTGQKPVVISFSATFCVPCMKELPILVKNSNNGSAYELIIFMVDTDDSKKVADFFKKAGIKRPFIYDINQRVIGNYINVDKPELPTAIFIGKSGVIAAVETGFPKEKQAAVAREQAYLDIIKSLEEK